MSSLSTLPKGDSAWLLRKSIQRIMQQVSVLETNIGSSTTGNSADTQVIFNDNGTLRGDTGLTYDKSADRLSFGAGICYGLLTSASATITGDLTVDTNTLKVDSANNRVGIGTASPAAALVVNLPEVSSAAGTSAIISNTTGGGNRIAALRLQNLTNQWNIRAYGSVTDDLRFGSGAAGSEVDYLSIGNTGIFTWSNVGGVAGTAMTLNATGLGVGVASPSYNIHARGTTNGRIQVEGASGFGMVFIQGSSGNTAQLQLNSSGGTGRRFNLYSDPTGFFGISDETAVATRLTIDSTGNVISNVTGTAPTLATNSQMVFNLTSNTNLRISVRGTDGTTRTANITLA